MRLVEIQNTSGIPLSLRFHRRITIVTGLDDGERRRITEWLGRVLLGTSGDSVTGVIEAAGELYPIDSVPAQGVAPGQSLIMRSDQFLDIARRHAAQELHAQLTEVSTGLLGEREDYERRYQMLATRRADLFAQYESGDGERESLGEIVRALEASLAQVLYDPAQVAFALEQYRNVGGDAAYRVVSNASVSDASLDELVSALESYKKAEAAFRKAEARMGPGSGRQAFEAERSRLQAQAVALLGFDPGADLEIAIAARRQAPDAIQGARVSLEHALAAVGVAVEMDLVPTSGAWVGFVVNEIARRGEDEATYASVSDRLRNFDAEQKGLVDEIASIDSQLEAFVAELGRIDKEYVSVSEQFTMAPEGDWSVVYLAMLEATEVRPILEARLAEHPVGHQFGAYPLIIDDAIDVLSRNSRKMALDIFDDIGDDFQVIIFTGVADVQDWARAVGSEHAAVRAAYNEPAIPQPMAPRPQGPPQAAPPPMPPSPMAPFPAQGPPMQGPPAQGPPAQGPQPFPMPPQGMPPGQYPAPVPMEPPAPAPSRGRLRKRG